MNWICDRGLVLIVLLDALQLVASRSTQGLARADAACWAPLRIRRGFEGISCFARLLE